MTDEAKLAPILRKIIELVASSDVDAAWGARPIGTELAVELEAIVNEVDAGRLSETGTQRLKLMFAPTGVLQEVAMANGWADECIVLSSAFDQALLH